MHDYNHVITLLVIIVLLYIFMTRSEGFKGDKNYRVVTQQPRLAKPTPPQSGGGSSGGSGSGGGGHHGGDDDHGGHYYGGGYGGRYYDYDWWDRPWGYWGMPWDYGYYGSYYNEPVYVTYAEPTPWWQFW